MAKHWRTAVQTVVMAGALGALAVPQRTAAAVEDEVPGGGCWTGTYFCGYYHFCVKWTNGVCTEMDYRNIKKD